MFLRLPRVLVFFLGFLFVLLIFPNKSSAAVLFQDNFDDGNANGWIVARNMQWGNNLLPCYKEGQPTDWAVQDGKYGIYIVGQSCVTETMPASWDNSWNNYIFEADVIFVRGTDGNIAFRYSGSPNFDWYGYHFQIDSNPSFSKVTLQRVLNTSIYSDNSVFYLERNTPYHLKIIVNNEEIKLFINDNLALDYPDAGGRFTTGRIALQASVGGDPESQVWFDNVVVSSIGDEPEEKDPVVLLPGFGASWDKTALVIGGPGDDWTKTPFVNVYDNLRNTFIDNAGYTEGDDYFEFYYDWRKPLTDLADDFDDFLQTTVLTDKPEDTKVDLVGHSLGGMVARVFAQEHGIDKLDEIVTTGSPHEGAIPAWLAWSGAEVGERWSWQWLALQLYLQIHNLGYASPVTAVRGLTPGLKDLLPIFDFAKDEGDSVIPYTSLTGINDYLDSLESSLSTEVKGVLNTIAGREDDPDRNTVEWLTLGERSWIDQLLGRWPDGKPVAKETTDAGDLTVLQKSATVSGVASTAVVNTTHVSLPQTKEGIQAILDALDLSGVAPATGVDPLPRNPSLVFFLHSPAELTVTAPDESQAGFGVASPMANSLYSPEDKLLVIYNALAGIYGVEILGTGTGPYHLEVGQLTEAGEFFNTLSETTSAGETDTFQLDFNPEDPLAQPVVDETGKTQLLLAKARLEELKDAVNRRWFKNFIDQMIRLIDRAVEKIDQGRFLWAQVYVQRTLLTDYYLRLFSDRHWSFWGLTSQEQILAHNLAAEAGQYLEEAFVITFDLSGRRLTSRQVQSYIRETERLKARVDRRLESYGQENQLLGETYELAEASLAGAKADFDSGNLSSAYAQLLAAKILYQEALGLL
ncbi:MAG: hypothetical protein UX85_C0002G0002 [Candidatus Beckwithbacteria bacterium GW2011_GWB1_47_15]|uniref:Uncharacterized protein n=1 Tax=Candidatus Beckwithbacteria bacterium GW2011_GWB1_47_15 TaxID=1618371 RepID=A0A0G1RWX0_9BACT|nr:MAG: hypothetical protein UV17_C0038G0003 [Candidatus Gottesmanbacteria bacterium GW2011_GWA1_42_26]KKU61622.1 MAG: hypothetical protein UX85_C0002G0002 [Candidatus Beckwithbacteria bacterium GW2011_GWB1_47_15]KKU71078.1 MAG: hypothetical protein UX97_C0012G0003 [Candidatus Beckwithbacteria bacterium GW2011_GWA2_47_25]KKW04751.1 MAG: hypothetical protein UY37_C0002G0004 [Candidatus Beckwithbacteria bacterium GW2011_GWC2_49_11]HAF64130.1 hypothetical protein [Candidatus Beckwithbacteria bacte